MVDDKELLKLKPLLEKYSAEYIFCAVDLDEKIAMLEAKLHSVEDPEEIAKEALISTAEFYDGDWCGIVFSSVTERRMLQRRSKAYAPDRIKKDTDVIINLIGDMEIYTSKGYLTEETISFVD